MPLLRAFEIDGTRVLAVNHPQITAAMTAIGDIWRDIPNSPDKVAIVVRNLDALYRELAPLAKRGRRTSRS